MLSLLLLTLSLPAADEAPAPGTLLVIRGQIIAAKGENLAGTRKTFEAEYVVTPGDGTAVLWSLAEQGRGGWSWTEQFGRAVADARLRLPAEQGPSLLYSREEGPNVIPLIGPFFRSPEPLAKGVTWMEAGLEYRVEGEADVGGKAGWVVIATGRIGRKRTFVVDKAAPVILSNHETVFMGQGQEHTLTWELARRDALAAAPLTHLVAAYDALDALRTKVLPQRRLAEVEWKPEQLAILREETPAAAKKAATTLLERISSLAELDVRFQKSRSGALAALKKEYIGKPAGDFSLSDLDQQTITAAQLAKKVVVLHFWDYRDPPTEAPYGQVGYLDFLHRQRKDAGLVVYGVAVKSELSDPERRRAAIANTRKFRDFMNVSYPILLDSGATLKQFGDPRLAGAKLPLFVVIGKDGKILEYQPGLYDTGRDQGLKELEAIVAAALK